jgi:large repetitive protein
MWRTCFTVLTLLICCIAASAIDPAISLHDTDRSSNYSDLLTIVDSEPPSITGQGTLAVNEDGQITLAVTDFQISDPDSNYPGDFTLTVYSGTGYSVSGTTVTPDPNFNGTLTVPVSVNDGTTESEIFNAQLTVNSINDAPVLDGQNALTFQEDQAFQITTADLQISDPDDTEFTLSIQAGSNYTVSGNTITPSANFNGTLSIPLSVSDGELASNTLTVSVTIQSVNDPPVITGQSSVSTPEDQAVTLGISNLTVSDPDHAQAALSLTVNAGDNYTVSGTTITPAANYNGTLTVPVSVSDGIASTDIFNMSVTVTAVNDAPVIVGHNSLSTPEDTPITLSPSDLSISDVDNGAGDFTIQVSGGANYSVAGTTVTPAPGFNGTLQVPVTVSDGSAQSNQFNVQIQVASVNNPPDITGQTTASTQEDQPFVILSGMLEVVDIDGNFPTGYTITPQAGLNYSVSGTTITPAPNFTGTLTIPIIVNDGFADSAPFDFVLSVTPINDAPVIVAQQAITTTEDQVATITFSHLTVTDPDNNYPSGFSITISAGENYTVDGASVIPAAEFSGVLTVPVTVSDGSAASEVFNVTIGVTPVNDAPVITGQAGLSVAEEQSITLELNQFTVVDPDNTTYPTGFTLQVLGGDNYTVSGTTVTPAANFTGSLTVGVTVSDGNKTSETFNATINVGSVNDSPVITGQVALEVDEEKSLTIQLAHLTVTDTDSTYPQGFSLTIHAGNNYTFSGTAITPVKDFTGELIVPITVSDGSTSSNIFELKISVKPVNDPPSITGQKTVNTYKNTAISLTPDLLTIADPDNSSGFTISVQAGQNYSVSMSTITPALNYIGTLNVPVTVSDGLLTSNVFTMKVNVVAPPNVPPLIAGQVTLTTFENQRIAVELGHLVVTDPDNRYPDDFKLTLFPGNHYSLSGNNVVPEKDYSGTLSVPVTVSDKESTSPKFILTIQVVPATKAPLITSQAFLRMNEDDSLVLKLSDVVVLDSDNNYPTGFTMQASTGSNYELDGLEVKPSKDYSGYLSVPVTVNDGVNTSTPYQLLILVDPVNDPPKVTDTEPGDLVYDRVETELFKTFTIEDVDDDTLTFAQVTMTPAFVSGTDSLIFTDTPSIRGILDRESNTLVVFGNASVSEYETFVRSVRYVYSGTPSPTMQKTFALSVSDGKAASEIVEKVLKFEEPLTSLDIPTGFTPNGDGANDTWVVRPPDGNGDFSEAIIRVYSKRGSIVYEARGLDSEWDGRMNGSLLPADTYFYTIDLKGAARTNRYKGVITILR